MGDAKLQSNLDVIDKLAKAGDFASLSASLENIMRCYADNAEALKDIAHVLNRNDRFEEALSVARQGLRIDPNHPLLHHNAARALSITGNIALSRPHSERASRLLPDNPWLQYHFASIQLCLGEFEEGWKRYRWYYRIPGKTRELVYPPFAPWEGQPLAGTTFLLVGEQGRGDEIQLIRFVYWLHEQGAVVDVLVSEPVAPLAASVQPIRRVYTRIPPGPYTYWCHMFAMPGFMKLDLSMLPIATSYLAAPASKVDDWRRRLDTTSSGGSRSRAKRIGLVWSGSPHAALDRFRSIPLHRLRTWFAQPGVTWYSLQKGPREQESQAFEEEFDMHTLGPAIEDFTDTLAILHALDLVITVDTSVAHLAGAAGLPVWVLVPPYCEWRWMTDRTGSPWYPSMRLFRQQQPGGWTTVIDEVRHAVQAWLPASSSDARTRFS